jgi:M6 family metalloprotease-like protein
MHRKEKIIVLSAMAVLALAGCNQPTASEASSSESASASDSASSTPSYSANAKYTTMTIKNSSIVAGDTFYEGCVPTVIYTDESKGTSTDYTDYANFVTYTIVSKDDGKTYAAGDALQVGSYTATARVKTKASSVDFTVTSGDVKVATEGNGYKTISSFATSQVRNSYPNLDVLGGGCMPNKGNVKILVVPVTFSNLDSASWAYTAADLKRINDAFFGAASDTSWESLASYYKKASYGQLNISGAVTPVYTVAQTTDQFESNGSAQAVVGGLDNWLISNGFTPKDYDSDGDGYIDGIELVYKTDKKNSSEGGKDIWWNYTSNASTSPDKTTPTPHRFFWSLYSYLGQGHYKDGLDLDAHTLVHETGHMMGLDDYYDYNKTSASGPAGCVDMMDFNVGDHNGFSKMTYDWLGGKARGVDGKLSNFTITLNSYTDTGDCLIVRDPKVDPWNGTAYDEYLLLEYYTPTGVNKSDSHGYGEWTQNGTSTTYGHGGTYEKPGLQVFHVDSRLYSQRGTYDVATGTTLTTEYAYTDNILNSLVKRSDGTWEDAGSIAHVNNTSSDRKTSIDIADGLLTTADNKLRLLSIVTPGLDSWIGSGFYGAMGAQTNLYSTSEFGGGSDSYSNFKERDFFFNDFKFNDQSTMPYTISVTDQTFDSTAAEGTNSGTITLHFVEH